MAQEAARGPLIGGYKRIVFVVCSVAALGGLLFGLDQGFIANSLATLTEHYQFRHDARRYQESSEFKQEYARRAGMEGTISEAVRSHHARRSRYLGQAKSELQAFLTAIAINIKRSARWLLGERPAQTRPPGLSCLASA